MSTVYRTQPDMKADCFKWLLFRVIKWCIRHQIILLCTRTHNIHNKDSALSSSVCTNRLAPPFPSPTLAFVAKIVFIHEQRYNTLLDNKQTQTSAIINVKCLHFVNCDFGPGIQWVLCCAVGICAPFLLCYRHVLP